MEGCPASRPRELPCTSGLPQSPAGVGKLCQTGGSLWSPAGVWDPSPLRELASAPRPLPDWGIPLEPCQSGGSPWKSARLRDHLTFPPEFCKSPWKLHWTAGPASSPASEPCQTGRPASALIRAPLDWGNPAGPEDSSPLPIRALPAWKTCHDPHHLEASWEPPISSGP